VKKLLATLFVAGLLGGAVAAGGASAALTGPGCGSFGIIHTGC
jgi:hypothetical protein